MGYETSSVDESLIDSLNTQLDDWERKNVEQKYQIAELHRDVERTTKRYTHLAAQYDKLIKPMIDDIGEPKLTRDDYGLIVVRYMGVIVIADNNGYLATDEGGEVYRHDSKPRQLASCFDGGSSKAICYVNLNGIDWTETVRKVSDLEVVR